MKERGGGFGIPVRMLSLRERANHSNFAQCDHCYKAKEDWLTYRTSPDRAAFGNPAEIKAKLFRHIED
eukprot:907426-Pleurochrysis_carterae.AAC.1